MCDVVSCSYNDVWCFNVKAEKVKLVNICGVDSVARMVLSGEGCPGVGCCGVKGDVTT